MLIIFCGLPGVGKTTVARIVANRLRAAYVRIDTIEQALKQAGAGPVGPQGYLVAYGIAADNLALGLTVVADCVNAADVSRAAWREVAQDQGRRCLFVQLVCSDAGEHRRRIEERRADLPGHVLPTWAAVTAMAFAPAPPDALVLDTARLDPYEAADQVIRSAADEDRRGSGS